MIKIYSTEFCSFCTKAKELLDDMGIPYENINIYEDTDGMEVMREMEFTTVPQILVEDMWIGGYVELAEMQEAGALDTLVEG
jgi:glutaredoxin 3